jgi:hypothetical protein
MKLLIPILIGLLVVGCGEVENGAYKHRPKQTDTNELTPTTNTNKANGTTAKPVKELTLREKVVGTYELELKKFGETHRYVLLDNSTVEYYLDGKKEEEEHKWSIVDKEVHIERENRAVSVFSINKDESITGIATIDEDGKRKEILKEHQYTREKIKADTNETPSKGDDKNGTKAKSEKELTKEDVVGTYEMKIEESTARMVILKNGIVESYLKDEKVDEGNVSIINGEVHIKSKTNEGVSVLRHEPNGDLKWIAVTVAGERKDLPKDKQETAKKIK